MTKIAFRVDGGASIGMGHIMRCLALASFFPDNVEIYFITFKNPVIKNLLKRRGYRLISLSQSMPINEEIEKVKDVVRLYNIDIIITDSYKIDYNYLFELKGVVERLVSIHDFAPHPFPSDIVINGNIYGPELDYSFESANTKFLLGTKYTLMRKEFYNLPIKIINKDIGSILVTVGGGDPLNLTSKIIDSIKYLEQPMVGKETKLYSTQKIHFDIVIGPAFDNIDLIIDGLKDISFEISLHFNVKQISKLMLKSDLAISAGGSTLYELAAAGVPTMSLLQSENQILAAEKMDNQGIIINLGYGNKVSTEDITGKLKYLIEDYELRKRMSKKGQELCDGSGAERCVKEILAL